MDKETLAIYEKMHAKNRASEKQCKDCVYYVENYKDDFTIKHFGYGEVKYRPACSFCNNYSFVSHNPAAHCKDYKKRQNQNEQLKK